MKALRNKRYTVEQMRSTKISAKKTKYTSRLKIPTPIAINPYKQIPCIMNKIISYNSVCRNEERRRY
jgi:hypothetical protein